MKKLGPALLVLLAAQTLACGGRYAGLGDDNPLEDTAPVETGGADSSSTLDTDEFDGGGIETGGLDTSTVADTTIDDTATAMDTSVSDTTKVDTSVADTGPADTGTADTGTTDTGAKDTADGGETVCTTVVTPDTTPTKCSTGPGTVAVTMKWVNNCSLRKIAVFWVDYSCVEKPYGTVAPGATGTQPTYVGHPWRLRDAVTKELLKEVPAATGPGTVTVNVP